MTVLTFPNQFQNRTSSIPLLDLDNNFEALRSVTASSGAAHVGINDAGGFFTADQVEGALQELGTSFAGKVNKAGDTMTGALTLNTGGGVDAVLSETGIAKNSVTAQTFNISNASGTIQLLVNGQPVWSGSNDGIGSGLDADLLQGQSGSYFVDRANHTGPENIATTLTVAGHSAFGNNGQIDAVNLPGYPTYKNTVGISEIWTDADLQSGGNTNGINASFSVENTSPSTTNWINGIEFGLVFPSTNSQVQPYISGTYGYVEYNGTADFSGLDVAGFEARFNSPGLTSTSYVEGSYSIARVLAGTVANAWGASTIVTSHGTATVTGGMISFEATGGIVGSVAIPNYTGIKVTVPGGAGPVTNVYGLSIDDFTGRGGTISYNMISKGASSRNVFEGRVDVNTLYIGGSAFDVAVQAVPIPLLKSATTTINIGGATAPTAGQVLTASSGTAAAWSTPVTPSFTFDTANTYLGTGGAYTATGTTTETFTHALLSGKTVALVEFFVYSAAFTGTAVDGDHIEVAIWPHADTSSNVFIGKNVSWTRFASGVPVPSRASSATTPGDYYFVLAMPILSISGNPSIRFDSVVSATATKLSTVTVDAYLVATY